MENPTLIRNETTEIPFVRHENITIAITVYDRREYLRQAIRSALAQQHNNAGPRVLVVEDCGPDLTLREAIDAEFGDRIGYHRNTQRRGLFGNWNACLEECTTDWLCILHDDDFLEPTFAASMIELAGAAPHRALYFGACHVIDEKGRRLEERPKPQHFEWHEPSIETWVRYDPVCFPGQLMNVGCARAVGGFRSNSRYCADWEMWFKLALCHSAAATNRVVANYREHHALGRGTTDVNVTGKKYALVNAQRKKHIAEMRHLRPNASFNRRALLSEEPIPTRFLLRHAHAFSNRMLHYNFGLLTRSGAPHLSYRFFQLLVRLLGSSSLRYFSHLYNSLGRQHTARIVR